MNPEYLSAHKRALLLCDWFFKGRYVTVTEGVHRGEKGILLSVTQPPLRDLMMDRPDDSPLPYATVRWPSRFGDPYDDIDHNVKDVILYEPTVF